MSAFARLFQVNRLLQNGHGLLDLEFVKLELYGDVSRGEWRKTCDENLQGEGS